MRTILVSLLALASALVVAPAAGAKGISKMEVCGASHCATLPGEGDDLEALMIGSSVAGPPDGPAPWYVVRSTVTPSREQGEDFEPFTFREAYVPSAGLLRVRAEGGGFEWRDVGARYEAAMERATAGLGPRPAARLRGLDVEPLQANVDEVVLPPADAQTGGDGGTPWWIAAAAVAAALIAALALYGRRRARTAPATG
jgi:hypothetical protein